MANPDNPNGFIPVKMLSGAPYSGITRSVAVVDGADMFIGDMISYSGASNTAAVTATNDSTILGAVVGFGKVDGDGNIRGPYDPDNLTLKFYDDSEQTNTEWVAFYAPATDCIFEVQSNADLDLSVGDPCDIVATAGDQTSGRSNHEIGANTNSDFHVVEVLERPDNDRTLTNANYYVAVTQAETHFV